MIPWNPFCQIHLCRITLDWSYVFFQDGVADKFRPLGHISEFWSTHCLILYVCVRMSPTLVVGLYSSSASEMAYFPCLRESISIIYVKTDHLTHLRADGQPAPAIGWTDYTTQSFHICWYIYVIQVCISMCIHCNNTPYGYSPVWHHTRGRRPHFCHLSAAQRTPWCAITSPSFQP